MSPFKLPKKKRRVKTAAEQAKADAEQAKADAATRVIEELYSRIVADYGEFDDTHEQRYAAKYTGLWDELVTFLHMARKSKKEKMIDSENSNCFACGFSRSLSRVASYCVR